MNFAQKKVLSVAAGLASIVFTIVSVCTATVAWFSVNEQVSATGMNIRCADVSSPINLTYDVLKFDDDTKLGVSYGQTPAAIELPEYDSYISKKNEYANVVLRLEATFTEGLSTTDYVAFDIDCSADLFKTISESTYIDDQTSNVIQFKSVVYSYTFVDETTPPSEVVTASITDVFSETPAVNNDARYKSATTYFDSLYSSTVYVSPAERSSSKLTDKTVTLIPEIGTRLSVIESIVIYLELSYNFGLVDNYIDTRFNSGGSTISLIGDINDLSFYTTSNPVTLDSITLSTNAVSLVAGESTSVTSTSSGNITWRAAEDTGSVTLSNTSNTGATINGVNAGHAIVSATTGQASVYLDAAVARAVVAAVQLNRNSLNGLAGGTNSLTATPYNFTGTVTYSWSTGNSNVATVSSSGNPATVTFIDTGTTTITCTATDGTSTAYATCTVSVIHPTVTLNHTTLQGNIQDIFSLIATTSNFSGTVTYSWASSNSTIVSVNNNNSSSTSITCNQVGTATITVTASVNGTDEIATDTCDVTVVNFSLDYNELIGEKSDTATLTATAASATGLDGTVTYSWSTSNSSIATVSASSNSATITFVAVGTATITVEASNGVITLSDTCDVTIGELTLDHSTIYAMSTASDGTLTATLNGISGTATYSFSSGTTATATVSNTTNVATIVYVAAGSTVITCTATYSGTTFTATATVYVASASLDNTTLSGLVNATGTTTVTALGFTGTITYSVSSSNTGVATASMNSNVCTVTYVSSGTASITITVGDGNVSTSLTCTITVTSGGGYVKVTSAPSDWSGQYLIVSETDNVAFNGSLSSLDAVSNYVNVTISAGTIQLSDTYSFTISAHSGGGYDIKSNSGYYITNSSSTNNALQTSTSVPGTANTISLSSDKAIVLAANYLVYNSTSGQYRFRYYKAATCNNGLGTGSFHYISLFKKT